MGWRGRNRGAAIAARGSAIAIAIAAFGAARAPAAVVSAEQLGQPGFSQQAFTLRLVAAAGEPNAVAVTLVGTTADTATYSVRDLGTAPTPGTGCAPGGLGEVRCTVGRSRPPSGCNRILICTDAGARVVLDLALDDGDDSLDLASMPASDGGGGPLATRIDGGTGDDAIAGSPAGDTVEPGTGADTVTTGEGIDRIAARSGGPDGADLLDLGPGQFDTVSYLLATDGVTISLDAGADDGAPGEGDNVSGAELVEGGAGDDLIVGATTAAVPQSSPFIQNLNGNGGSDRIIGGPGPDAIRGGFAIGPDEGDWIEAGGGDDFVHAALGDDGIVGGPGNDRISAASGADLVRGSGGDDLVTGEAGADSVKGGSGDDSLSGGGGRDTIFAGAGTDHLFGNAAADLLRAVDGAPDRLDCGDGDDTIRVDRLDTSRNCER